MPKTLSDTSPRIRDSYKRVQDALKKDNEDYAIELLLSILAMEPELDEQRRELRQTQLGKLKKKKADPLSSMKGMSKIMAVKSAIKKDPGTALVKAEELLAVDPLNPAFLTQYVESATFAC